MSEFRPETYGAVGDGVADDTAEVQAAITAAGARYGSTLRLSGLYRISSPIIVDFPLSIRGDGTGTGFIVGLVNTGTAAVQIGNEAGVRERAANQTFRDFGIYGVSGSCAYGLAVLSADRCRFENVHVRPGSTRNAVLIAASLYCDFNFIVSNNTTGGYPKIYGQDPGTWNGAGILVDYYGPINGNMMPTNACVFDCVVQGGATTGGIAIKAQHIPGGPSTPQGNNEIRGAYEGMTGTTGGYGAGYGILIEGCRNFTIRNVHVEETRYGVVISESSHFAVRDSVISGSQDPTLGPQTLTVQNSGDFLLQRLDMGNLSVTGCSHYVQQALYWYHNVENRVMHHVVP